MAKFTAAKDVKLRWRGNDIVAAAGETARIPDAHVDDFTSEFFDGKDTAAANFPFPGFAWITQDETTAGGGGSHPDLATHDALGLVTQVELDAHTAAADPHTGYALDADLANHEAAADPHTGYRLESANHTHASSGLQAGQIAHSALTSVTADQHHAQIHVLATSAGLGADHTISGATAGHVLRATSGTAAAIAQLAHADLGSVGATDHHAAAAAGPDANVTIDSAGAAGTASTFARSGHGHQVVTTDAPSGANITIDAAATTAATGAIARAAHGHRIDTSSTTAAAIGTASAGTSGTISRAGHVHPTGAGTPSTQAMGDAAATGSGPAAANTDHKHAMPSLGFGLTGNSAPAVSLTVSSASMTAEVAISGTAYSDVTGASISLAAGTWIVGAVCVGRAVNLAFIMNVAITDGANAVVTEASLNVPASGTANVNSLGTVTLMWPVTPGSTTTYKIRAARGNAAPTNSWTAVDGGAVAVANNASTNTDKGTRIFAVRVA